MREKTKVVDDDVLSLDDFEGTPEYAQEFIDFINEASTIYHTVAYFKSRYIKAGFVELKENQDWVPLLHPGGKYYVSRGSSSLIAFSLGSAYQAGDPFAMIGSHIDALCMKVKPHSKVAGKEEWERLGVAPYSVGGPSVKWDASFSTWWDRDLGCGGRVLVRGENGTVVQKLIRLPGAVARIPTLATHFGEPAKGPFNYETQMVPIIGLNPECTPTNSNGMINTVMGKHHSARFLRAIASASGHGVKAEDILDFSLELFDAHPATLLGLSSEFISAPRMDDRLCSFAAARALINSCENEDAADLISSLSNSSVKSKDKKNNDGKKANPYQSATGRHAKLVALFDMEEVGSVCRVGARSNFLKSVVERVVEAFVVKSQAQHSSLPFRMANGTGTIGVIGQTLARSFLISADVSHAINPNFDGIYLEGGSPGLNKGPAIYMDPNGKMTSEPIGATLMRGLNEKTGAGEIQMLYPRNDSRTGGTIGPALSQDLGVRAIDMGIPMMSMHSIRAITGSKDPGIAIKLWEGFFDFYSEITMELDGFD